MKEGRRAAAGYVCGPIPNPLPRRGGAAVVFLEKHLRRLGSESIAAAMQRVSKTFVMSCKTGKAPFSISSMLQELEFNMIPQDGGGPPGPSRGNLHKRASLDMVRMEKLGAHSFWSDRMGVVGLLVADAGSGTFSRLAAACWPSRQSLERERV